MARTSPIVLPSITSSMYPAGFFVRVEKDMHFGNASKQVVQVAHDILISANHEDAEIIDFAGINSMKGQGISNIQQVDELGNLAIRIAGDVHDGAVALGRLGQAMNWHDGKELAEGPVIEERLKDGEIADVLIAQRSFELLYFVRDKSQTAMHADDLGGQLPVNAYRSLLLTRGRATRGRKFAGLLL